MNDDRTSRRAIPPSAFDGIRGRGTAGTPEGVPYVVAFARCVGRPFTGRLDRIEARHDLRGAFLGSTRSCRLVCLGNARRDQPRPRRAVIPGDHPVVDAQHRVGQREVVVAARRQTLEHAAPVVGEIAGCATLKRRQSVENVASMRTQQRRDLRERIAFGARDAPSSCDLSARALAHDDGDGIGGEKGVAAEARARRRAVEKQPVRQSRQAAHSSAPDRERL